MDIFEYIDRVKANFDKKPEPRYNTKKYLGSDVPESYGFDFMAERSVGPRSGSTVEELKDAVIERLVPDIGISYNSPSGFSMGVGPTIGESKPSINFGFRKEFDDGGVATPKRGLVDGPGSYGGERAIPNKYIDGIKVSETLDGKKTYYAKVKVGDETKSFSDSSLAKVKKWKEKNSAIARKKGFEKRDLSFAAEQTKKQRAKEAKKTAKARANVDKWTKNWLNKNLNKYGVRELDLFKKELAEDWAKELKKNPNLYKGKFDFKPTSFQERTMTMKNLPNLTGSSISDKPFKYGPRVVGDKATIETTLNKIFYDNKIKDKNFKNKVKNFLQHYVDGKPHGNNVVARNVYNSKTAKLLDDDVLYLLSSADSKLIGSAKQAVLVNALGNVYTDYRKVTDKMSANYQKNSQLIDEFLGGKNIIAKASVKEHNALKKIFDVSELPLTLRYNIDHMYGISEAAREITNPNPSKARVRAILNNTMGMTQKRNFMLGTEGYSFRRKNLINKINAGKNVDANLLKLNEATKAAYNVDNAYEIKKGKATPGKSFVGQTRPERFKSYFEDIYKTPQGKKEIIRQKGSLKNLIKAIGCPNNKAMGGRIGFKDGTSCFDKGDKIIQSGKPQKGAQFRNFVKLGQFLAKTGKTAAGAADILLSVGAGAKGLGVGLLLETGFAMEQASKGQPGLGFSQTVLGDLYNALVPDEKEINLENRLLKSAKTEEERVGLQNLIDFNKDQKNFSKKAKMFDYLYNAPEFEKEGVNLQKLEDELYEMYADLQDRTPKIMNKEVSDLLANVSYRVADEGRDKLKGFYGKIFGDRQLKDISMDRNVLAKSYYDAMFPQVSDVIGIPMFANTGEIQSTQQQLGLPTSYKATPQELDDIYDMGRLGASSGGIASGPPPKKGPQSQGLAYLMKNGKR